jgi:trk system potassium uptake protein TrkA
MAEYEVGVVGLGKFGFHFARTLVSEGLSVLGIDRSPDRVRAAQDELTHVYEANAMDKRMLEQLGFQDLTHVLVSVGQSIEMSLMIALYLKEMGEMKVWVKALSEDHATLLTKVGVDEVIFPERYAALQYAHKLAVPGLVEYLPFGNKVALKEITVDAWDGKSLKELDMTSKYHVQAVAYMPYGDDEYDFAPRASEPLKRGDKLIVMGQTKALEKLMNA